MRGCLEIRKHHSAVHLARVVLIYALHDAKYDTKSFEVNLSR